MKISRDFAEKMALLPLKNERIAIKSLEILANLFKTSYFTSYFLHVTSEKANADLAKLSHFTSYM